MMKRLNNKWLYFGLASSVIGSIIFGCTAGSASTPKDAAVVAANSPADSNTSSSPATDPSAKDSTASADSSNADPGFTLGQDSFVAGPAPEFKAKGVDGSSISISKLKGKVVMIDFWATWCPPCRAALPFTNRLAKTFGKKGLQVIALAEDTPEAVKPFLKKNGYTMPTFFDDSNNSIGRAYEVTGIPKTVIIDKTGKIVAEEVGLYPQAETIKNLKAAGLEMGDFAPDDGS